MRLSIEGARRGGYPVLGPITLEIVAGEVVALLGPSGIGKTTLLRLVAGLDPAPRGAVTGTGRLGMVFQEPTLLPWRSALANVALAADCDAASARTMLARVGLGGREDAFPRALSLGQQRRVALARAFAAEPETLLMDEPFVSLDPAASEEMQTLLSGLLADRPARVLMVTHSGDEALRLADRIAIMKDGAVEQCDRPDRIVMEPATEYVAKFIEDIEKARVVHARAMMQPVNGHDLGGTAVEGDKTISQLARLLINDDRVILPVAGPDGTIIGGLDRQKALDVLLGASE